MFCAASRFRFWISIMRAKAPSKRDRRPALAPRSASSQHLYLCRKTTTLRCSGGSSRCDARRKPRPMVCVSRPMFHHDSATWICRTLKKLTPVRMAPVATITRITAPSRLEGSFSARIAPRRLACVRDRSVHRSPPPSPSSAPSPARSHTARMFEMYAAPSPASPKRRRPRPPRSVAVSRNLQKCAAEAW